jgi:hypothetical protein
MRALADRAHSMHSPIGPRDGHWGSTDRGSTMNTPAAMTVIELTDEEVRLVRNALRSFLSAFGHDEADIVHAVQHLLDKLAASQAQVTRESQ